MIFNVNDTVKVKLTHYGRELYYHQYDRVNKSYGRIAIPPAYPKVDNDGYSSFQLWNLMKLYGSYLSVAGTVENNTLPFETSILIG